MRRYVSNLRLLGRRWLGTRAVGEEALHQGALHLAGSRDEGVLDGDCALDGAEDVSNAALFGEKREGDEEATEHSLADIGLSSAISFLEQVWPTIHQGVHHKFAQEKIGLWKDSANCLVRSSINSQDASFSCCGTVKSD
jgi:hypothetical protein